MAVAGRPPGNGLAGADVEYLLDRWLGAVPPAAAKRLEQGRGVRQPGGLSLHDLNDRLQVTLLRVEQQKHVGIAALHLLVRQIEACFGGALKVACSPQGVSVVL